MNQLLAATALGAGLTLFSTLISSPAQAARLFTATLNSEQSVPPAGQTNSPATGFATLRLNEPGTELAYSIDFFGPLDFGPIAGRDPMGGDEITLLHFHNAPRGEMGPVVFTMFGAPPPEDDDLSFSFNPDGSVTVSGIWRETDPLPPDGQPLSTFLPELRAVAPGEDTSLYLNLHSEADPVGVIRGQVVGAETVPEPGSLLGLALVGGMGWLGYRRRQLQ